LKKPYSNNQWNKSCKICKLFVTKPELWVEVHDRVNKKNETRASVCRWLNDIHLESLNEGKDSSDDFYFKPFSEQNFQSHFVGSKPYWSARDGSPYTQTGHCQDYMAVRRMVARKGWNVNDPETLAEVYKESLPVESDWEEADDMINELSKELMDYQNLSNMVGNFELVLTGYNDRLNAKIKEGKQISLVEIDQLQKQVTSLFNLQVELTELRNKAPIAGEAVKMGIELTVSLFLTALMSTVEDAKVLLMGELPGSGLPLEVSNMIMSNMRDSMKKAVPDVIKRVMSEYRIR